MKNTIFSLLLILSSIAVFGQTKGFRYQTVLRDVTRQVLVDRNVTFRIGILEGSPDGTNLYSEIHNKTTNQFGLVSFTIGGGEQPDGDFEEIPWGAGDFYLKIEIDPEGGTDFELMGASQLLAVPLATWETSDADRDPENELQDISINGGTIMLSLNGGFIYLPDSSAVNELQQIFKNGDTITLNQNGGKVVLLDDDPTNEIQTLELIEDTLTVSNGNSISLASLSPWVSVPGGINYPGNSVGINKDSFMENKLHIAGANKLLRLQGMGTSGSLGRMNFGDLDYVYLEEDNDDDLKIRADRFWVDSYLGVNTNSPNARLDVNSSFSISENDITRVYASANSYGWMGLDGSNGASNIEFGVVAGNNNHGWIGTFNGSGASRARMTILPVGNGYISTLGPNGNDNIRLRAHPDNPNYGCLDVCDASGNIQAQLCIDDDGKGQLWCSGNKHFKIDHPEDRTKEIWYACIEGPESAAYERGTSKLENGEAFIKYSEHFGLVVNPETVTISVTPLSSSTYGLSIVEKRKDGFVVKELMNGTQSFNFDWEVKGVRKGYENYKPIREKQKLPNYNKESENLPPPASCFDVPQPSKENK